MKLKVLILILFAFWCGSDFAQNVTHSLIVVHYDPASKGEFKQMVYSYQFLNGHYQGRQEIISFKGRVKDTKGVERDYIRTDIGNNILTRTAISSQASGISST